MLNDLSDALLRLHSVASEGYSDLVSDGIGKQIRTARLLKGWTIDDLARASGVSPRQIWNIENGADSKIGTLGKLRAALDLGESSPSSIANRAPDTSRAAYEILDFSAGLAEVPIVAEVACGEPMDHTVEGETVLVPAEYAPDESKDEYLVRARGESMVDFGIRDGWYVVVERREGGVAASGELILAWYEPADKAQPGGITLKRWFRRSGRKILQGSSPDSTFELKEGDVFELQGIVRRAYPPPLFFPKISG
jgi:SOS-response transcriptional repressor LexA